MKGFLTTYKGMEDMASLEVKELIGSKAEKDESCIVFNIKKYEDLFKLCYISQSAIGIHYLLAQFSYKNLFSDFKKSIEKIDFSKWLSKKTSFRVKCSKNPKNDLTTPELEKELGSIIIEEIGNKHSYSQKVDLNNPDVIIFVHIIDKKCFVGIDFSGFDLSKRSYNIFAHPASVRGPIAYAMIRLSGFDKGNFLDTFSGSGMMPIEAALFSSKMPVNFYNKEKFAFLRFESFKRFNFESFFEKIDKKISDKKMEIYNVDTSMKNISFAKKNAKIAGMGKAIIYSRFDPEWLDTKFEEGKINSIATKMPSSLDMKKLYNEFFYQAEFILAKKGKISLMGKKDMVKKYSAKYDFKIIEERSIFSGKEEYNVFVLQKAK